MSIEGDIRSTEPNKGWNSDEAMILGLQSHIPVTYQEALKENIPVLHSLFSKDLPGDNVNEDMSTELNTALIANIKSYLETFHDVFKYIPQPSNTQSPLVDSQNTAVHVDRSVKKFREVFRKQLRGVTFLGNDLMTKTLRTAITESLNHFEKFCSLKSTITNDEKVEMKGNLEERMRQEEVWLKAINTFRKNKVVEGIEAELNASFREAIQNEYPKIFQEETNTKPMTERNFYNEQELRSFTTDLMVTVLADFKNQIEFEKDMNAIGKLVGELEQQLQQEADNLIAKNLEKKQRNQDDEVTTEVAINKSLCAYKNQMASLLNSTCGPPPGINVIETQHCRLVSNIVQEFNKQRNDNDTSRDLLQCRIFESFRELVSTSHANAAKELLDFKALCKREISSCLEKLEQHLQKYTQESPTYIGHLRHTTDRWLKDTIKCTTKDTIIRDEGVKRLLQQVVPLNSIKAPAGTATTAKDDADKQVYINSLVEEAINYFIDMTENSRRRSNSIDTKASYIRNRVKSGLEFKIKASFGDCEPTAPYVKQLEFKINEYVMSKLVKAMEDVDKKIDVLLPPATAKPSTSSAVKSMKKESDKTKKVVDDVVKEELPSASASICVCVKTEIKSNESLLVNSSAELEEGEYVSCLDKTRESRQLKSLPLTFQFSVTSIKMAIMNPATLTPSFLPDEFGNLSTSTTVGLTKGGFLVYGPEVEHHKKNGSLNRIFDLDQHFINQNIRSPWISEVFIGGKKQKIAVELLLAFLLKRLKKTAEESFLCSCQQAVITIPYWFASAQRTQVKDAGRIAGFSEVTFIHNNSAAAYALANDVQNIRETMHQSDKLIMILSENMDYVESTVYSVVEPFPMARIKMVSNYGGDQLGVVLSGAEARNCRTEAATDNVMELCKKALSILQPSNVSPTVILGIDGGSSNGAFWRKVFQNVRMEYTGNSFCSMPNENEAVLHGAVQLSQNLANIGLNISDQIGLQLWRDGTKKEENKGIKGLLRDITRNKVPKPEKPLILKFGLRSNETTMTVYQNGLDFSKMVTSHVPRYGYIPVGHIKVFETYPDSTTGKLRQFFPILKLTNEGIISLDHVLTITRARAKAGGKTNTNEKKRKRCNQTDLPPVITLSPVSKDKDCIDYQYLSNNDSQIAWITLNLSEHQIETFIELISKM